MQSHGAYSGTGNPFSVLLELDNVSHEVESEITEVKLPFVSFCLDDSASKPVIVGLSAGHSVSICGSVVLCLVYGTLNVFGYELQCGVPIAVNSFSCCPLTTVESRSAIHESSGSMNQHLDDISQSIHRFCQLFDPGVTAEIILQNLPLPESFSSLSFNSHTLSSSRPNYSFDAMVVIVDQDWLTAFPLAPKFADLSSSLLSVYWPVHCLLEQVVPLASNLMQSVAVNRFLVFENSPIASSSSSSSTSSFDLSSVAEGLGYDDCRIPVHDFILHKLIYSCHVSLSFVVCESSCLSTLNYLSTDKVDFELSFVPPDWWDACDAVLSLSSSSSSSVLNKLAVIGPKSAGKSSFNRFLINRMISSGFNVQFVDCDIGQPEFTPSGLVSLHSLNALTCPALASPAFYHLREPDVCYCIGDFSPASCHVWHLDCISQLIRQALSNASARENSIIVLNCDGWVEDFGHVLLQRILDFYSPTKLFQIDDCFLQVLPEIELIASLIGNDSLDSSSSSKSFNDDSSVKRKRLRKVHNQLKFLESSIVSGLKLPKSVAVCSISSPSCLVTMLQSANRLSFPPDVLDRVKSLLFHRRLLFPTYAAVISSLIFVSPPRQTRNHVSLTMSKELRLLRFLKYFCACVTNAEDIQLALMYLRLIPLESSSSMNEQDHGHRCVRLSIENTGKLFNNSDNLVDFKILQAVWKSRFKTQKFQVNSSDDIVLPQRFDEVTNIHDMIQTTCSKLVGIIDTSSNHCLGIGIAGRSSASSESHCIDIVSPVMLPQFACLHVFAPTTPTELFTCPISSDCSFTSNMPVSEIKGSQPSGLFNSCGVGSRRRNIPRRKNN